VNKKPLTNKSGKVRELKCKDIGDLQSASEVLPADLLAVLPKRKVNQRERRKMPANKNQK
jgi:hypothetical protein